MLVQFRAPDLPPSGVPIKRKEGRVVTLTQKT